MELAKVNHAITQTNNMLKSLVDISVIEEQDRRNLLPVLVKHAIRNENIDIDYS
ncbi:MAG: hypothetical protein V3R52_07495 [Candidatus Neomarinimicrobiota bacterium]